MHKPPIKVLLHVPSVAEMALYSPRVLQLLSGKRLTLPTTGSAETREPKSIAATAMMAGV